MSLSKKLPPARTVNTKNKKKKLSPSLWFERTMAVFALLNYLLVIFDVTYIPLRDFWLQGRMHLFTIHLGKVKYSFPDEPLVVHSLPITQWYDWVKGIEPHRDTTAYLNRVDELQATLIEHSINSSQTEVVLADLQRLSEEMIDTNPFQIANKTGTLERIKNTMREHIPEANDSATTAFEIFWSQDYLQEKEAFEQLQFFNEEVRPLIETNYFRPIGENGEPVDNFGILDLPFTSVFLLEFLARSWFISRRKKGVSWFDAMLWRWYDILFFIPTPGWFRVIRLARIIPVMVRLDQSNLVDMNAVKKQASQGFVASIAEDLTEVVIVGVLNQVQGSIKSGEIINIISSQGNNPYIDLNDTNEVAEISRLVVQLVVNQVLPAAQPDIEELLQYSVERTINEVPGYQNFRQLPGMTEFTSNLTYQTIHQIYNIVYTQIQYLIKEDPEFDKLLEQVSETFMESVRSQMNAEQTTERLEYLLVALIEEVKVNYVQRLSQEDIEDLMDQTRELRQVTQVSKN